MTFDIALLSCNLGITIILLLVIVYSYLSQRTLFARHEVKFEAQLQLLDRFTAQQDEQRIDHHERLLNNLSSNQQQHQNNFNQLQKTLTEMISTMAFKQQQALTEIQLQLQKELNITHSEVDKRQKESMQILHDNLQKIMREINLQIGTSLNNHSQAIGKQVDKLTEEIHIRLKEISGQVEHRLSEGFAKTTATFADVLKRLALIDEAQKRITELSGNIMSLQEILADKRSRGAFGEVQLSALIKNLMAEPSFALQHTLSNGKRADCILFLPQPTGHMVIDAKFPLENYRKWTNLHATESEKRSAEQLFRQDIRKHIHDIASKYIIPGETADGAVMFIPAEAIFAEIHTRCPELVEEAYKARVWMASPTTMMAILTTARAVIKDADTRKQVHVIQEHLGYLAKDFSRFQKRIDNLARHIHQANEDAKDVSLSAHKLSNRFYKIEQVELPAEVQSELEMLETISD